MVRMSVRLATLVVLVSLAACAPAAPPPPPDTTAEDTTAINALRDSWVTAYNAGDLDALVNAYAENVVEMPNEAPTEAGRDAIRARLTAEMAIGKPTASLTSEELILMGDWAYDRGTFAISFAPAAGGDPINVAGRYSVLLHQGADGAWKVARGMNNTATPPAAAAAGSN